MCYSQTHTIAPVAERPSLVTKSLSHQPQLLELSLRVHGDPLTSRPPRLPDLSFALQRSNAVRHSATNESVQLSPVILTQAEFEAAAVPEPPANSRQSPVRKFNLSTHHLKQLRVMARYYVSALTLDDHVALTQGEENHNHKSWTSKDMVLFEELRKEIMPTNMYIGPDKHVCIIPVIIVTQGQDERTHTRQLFHEYRT